MSNQNKAYIYALLAVLMWSTVASAFKIALLEISPGLTLFYASISASFILFVLLLLKKETQQINIKSLSKSLLPAFFNPFLYYLILFEAYSLLPAQIAQPLNYTWPIVLSIFSSIFYNEKIKIGAWLGFVISFIGVIIISWQNPSLAPLNSIGIFLAVGSSIIWSIYWILNLKDTRSNSLKLFMNFGIGSIYILIYLLIIDVSFNITMKGLLSCVYIGFFEMGITFFLWLKALSLSPQITKINNLVFLSPFLSLIFISYILKENIQTLSILGLIVIVLGIIIQKLIKN